MSGPRIAYLLYPGVTQLDLTGPAQFLSRLGDLQADFVWKEKAPIPTDSGFSILPTATLAEVAHADILFVPGGIGCLDVMEDDEVLAWLDRIGAGAGWVTSVCTGSLALAAAGLLRGYKAACHWAWRDQLRLFGAEPVAERVVVDRNRISGGGVTAGIDFALTLVAELRGEDFARMVQLALEYDPAPPFDNGVPEKATAAQVEAYLARTSRLAPRREERIAAVAARRGFA